MLKRNKWKWILSSGLILLPTVFGLLVWKKLPPSMPVHWGINGEVDRWGSPLEIVLVLPLVLLAIHWLGMFLTARDNKTNDQNKKILGMIFWICPIISLFTGTAFYAGAFGVSLSMNIYVILLIGLTFILVGNYLPKCRPNRTIGIRVYWTLANEENWVHTHRFAGKVFVILGVLCLPAVFLPANILPYVLIALLTATVIACVVYPYCFYKKQLREGTWKVEKHQ